MTATDLNSSMCFLREGKSPQIRYDAAWNLLQLARQDSHSVGVVTPALLEVLVKERDTEVRRVIIYVVDKLEVKGAIETLIKIAMEDMSRDCRVRAVDALGDIGGQLAKLALEQMLDHCEDERLGVRVVGSLGRILASELSVKAGAAGASNNRVTVASDKTDELQGLADTLRKVAANHWSDYVRETAEGLSDLITRP